MALEAEALIPLFAAFLFALAIFGSTLMWLILFYHWIRYDFGVVGTFGAMVIYTGGLGILLFSLFSIFYRLDTGFLSFALSLFSGL